MENNCNVSWFQCPIFDKDKTLKLVDTILAKEREGRMGEKVGRRKNKKEEFCNNNNKFMKNIEHIIF